MSGLRWDADVLRPAQEGPGRGPRADKSLQVGASSWTLSAKSNKDWTEDSLRSSSRAFNLLSCNSVCCKSYIQYLQQQVCWTKVVTKNIPESVQRATTCFPPKPPMLQNNLFSASQLWVKVTERSWCGVITLTLYRELQTTSVQFNWLGQLHQRMQQTSVASGCRSCVRRFSSRSVLCNQTGNTFH